MTGIASASPAPRSDPLSAAGLAALSLANAGLWAALFGPIELLLAQHSSLLAPDGKVAVLGMVSAAGGAAAMLTNPIFGALSDRTRSRFGRRRPWVALGALAGAGSLLLLSGAQSVAMLTLGWCLVQASLNAMMTALVATIADRVPVAERGAAGAWFAFAQALGIVGGVALAHATAPDLGAGYRSCAALLLVCALPFLLIEDPGPTPLPAPPTATAHPPAGTADMVWAWLTRFCFNLISALALLYLLYYLGDAIHRPAPDGDVLLLTALHIAAMVIVLVPAGLASDRIARRKPFVLAASTSMAIGMTLLAVQPAWGLVITGVAFAGIGFGLYSAVDVAIVTEVIPEATESARDLGIFNIANALPQVAAPALAAALIAFAGYGALYGAGALLALVAAATVLRIRAVG
ncbi:MFS transporter [Sphingomonas sp. NIBR02145]|uniref:MFS transporter n=1 Tax=Sphingomonas sp. NIBR02145 TaxID=3014784 RepID=UPI0022B46B99|nr:MFS transporter [Sphingomonas sp. NIBR02145]WHU04618.1 MFS transporter [Sphingomonas sp. NIBR02145]